MDRRVRSRGERWRRSRDARSGGVGRRDGPAAIAGSVAVVVGVRSRWLRATSAATTCSTIWPRDDCAARWRSKRTVTGTRSTPLSARPNSDGDGWVLNGVKPLVLDGHTADFAYVVAQDGDGLAHVRGRQPRGRTGAVDGRDPQDCADGARPSAGAPRRSRRVTSAPCWRGSSTTSASCLCAESVGACDRALTMATEYAKVRVQFDRPIATFQAIRHKIVDMLHQLELARVATHYAAWTSDSDDARRVRRRRLRPRASSARRPR